MLTMIEQMDRTWTRGAWIDDPITPKQRQYIEGMARILNINITIPPSKGGAAQLISSMKPRFDAEIKVLKERKERIRALMGLGTRRKDYGGSMFSPWHVSDDIKQEDEGWDPDHNPPFQDSDWEPIF